MYVLVIIIVKVSFTDNLELFARTGELSYQLCEIRKHTYFQRLRKIRDIRIKPNR